MKFLKGNDLTTEIQRLVSGSNAKIAIAYWGVDALKRLDNLKPGRNDLKIVCCLSGGKSAPEVIEQFGERARQNDKLHAKVIWTPSGAIVGSANASSNGLPNEERGIEGLIEAGAYLDGAEELRSIESWFDKLYKESRPITKPDLEAAKKVRRERGRQPNPEVVDIPIDELKKRKIAVLLWSEEMTAQENREVKKLDEPLLKEKNLDWYTDTREHAPKYPYEYETIAFQTNRERTRLLSKYQLQIFFPKPKEWHKIRTQSNLNRVIFSLDLKKTDIARRNYKIGEASEERIRELLQRRKLRLRYYLDSGPEEGFTSWEPLNELLAHSTAKK